MRNSSLITEDSVSALPWLHSVDSCPDDPLPVAMLLVLLRYHGAVYIQRVSRNVTFCFRIFSTLLTNELTDNMFRYRYGNAIILTSTLPGMITDYKCVIVAVVPLLRWLWIIGHC